jgi:hypothetical protein
VDEFVNILIATKKAGGLTSLRAIKFVKLPTDKARDELLAEFPGLTIKEVSRGS